MKKKIHIIVNVVVMVLLLVMGVLCLIKSELFVDKTNENGSGSGTSITTEVTTETDTTSAEETTETTTELETSAEVSTSNETESTTTTVEFIGPVMTETTTVTTVTSNVTTGTTGTTAVPVSVSQPKTTTTKEAANPTPVNSGKNGLTLVKNFTGTYYAYGGPRKGGSGRQLINCATGGQGVKGSIACRYLYSKYGYKKNGRTKVYIEVEGYSKMNGWYYLDDCCGSYNVIDFFYINGKSCPFSKQGIVKVKCYI